MSDWRQDLIVLLNDQRDLKTTLAQLQTWDKEITEETLPSTMRAQISSQITRTQDLIDRGITLIEALCDRDPSLTALRERYEAHPYN